MTPRIRGTRPREVRMLAAAGNRSSGKSSLQRVARHSSPICVRPRRSRRNRHGGPTREAGKSGASTPCSASRNKSGQPKRIRFAGVQTGHGVVVAAEEIVGRLQSEGGDHAPKGGAELEDCPPADSIRQAFRAEAEVGGS